MCVRGEGWKRGSSTYKLKNIEGTIETQKIAEKYSGNTASEDDIEEANNGVTRRRRSMEERCALRTYLLCRLSWSHEDGRRGQHRHYGQYLRGEGEERRWRGREEKVERGRREGKIRKIKVGDYCGQGGERGYGEERPHTHTPCKV